VRYACPECHQIGSHHSRCPEASSPVAVYECTECGYEIYDGDTYYRVGWKIYCKDCIEYCKHIAESGEVNYDWMDI